MTEVRRAAPADNGRLAQTLARAFEDDPVMSWMFPDDRTRLARITRVFEVRTRYLVGQDDSWTTADVAGAALWAQPDAWRVGLRETLALSARTAPYMRLRFPQVLRGLHAVEQIHPHKPSHYYLAILGTDPSRQGEGIGSRLLAPVLDRCDADGVGAFLESSKERNIAFYARHGFKVTGEVTLPGGGPTVWPMWRDPR